MIYTQNVSKETLVNMCYELFKENLNAIQLDCISSSVNFIVDNYGYIKEDMIAGIIKNQLTIAEIFKTKIY